jgi:allophanate hydrolase subunit 2
MPPELILAEPPTLALPPRIRAVPGPQEHRFTPEAVAHFAESDWRVGARGDRMGIRLEGPRLAHQGGHDIVSDGTVTGSIQVPGNGQPIVLLADRQTTGGYPKIATVISADLPALGRARPGDAVRFELIGAAEAASARAEYRARLAAITASLRPAGGEGLDLERLYSENLISGVFG